MSKFSTISRRALIFAAAMSLLLPAGGYAHALFADHNPNRPVLEYVWVGFWHMVGGWDHLLFIVGVVLIAGALKPAAKLITLFVLGHSLTLIVATVAGWKLNATLVDVVIALSLVYIGLVVAGILAALLMAFPIVGEDEPTTQVASSGDESSEVCTQDTASPPTALGGTDPPKTYFSPDEMANEEDFTYAIAAPDPEQAEPLRVIAALRTMSCREPDMNALAGFYDSWMLEVQGRQG